MSAKDILIISTGFTLAISMGILSEVTTKNPIETSGSEIDIYDDLPSMDSHSETSLFQITK